MIKTGKAFAVILLILLIFNLIFNNIMYAHNGEMILEIVQANAEQKDLPNDQRVYF